MRVPFRWLQDFVKIDVSPQEACEYLIMLGFADARVIPNEWDCLENFVAGRAVNWKAHPEDDHLKIVEVNVGYATLTSVCGAPNVQVGSMYAVALPGARLAGGRAVETSEVSGITSQCILCSGWEAWIDDSKEELLALDSDTTPGTQMIKALALDQAVIEMEVTPNRGDCLGIIGVARELAAVFGKELNIPEPGVSANGSTVEKIASVEIVDAEACPRYGAAVLEDVTVQGSPADVRARLRLAGMRPINNVVDATNLVLFETGHPLHAFDLDWLSGQRIIVRRGASGETITAIDGKEYNLTPEDLVIADAEKPVAIAGVIGGANSEVTPSTTRVLIEGAFFHRSLVWNTSKRLGIESEAAYRFARVVDIGAVLYVLTKAAALIQGQTGCRVARGLIDVYPDPEPAVRIYANPKRMNKLLGTSIPEQEILDYLERLGFMVSPGKDLEVLVPTRRTDVLCEADITEEVARMYGYDRIESVISHNCRSYAGFSEEMELHRSVRQKLTGIGLMEAVTEPMLGPETLEAFGITRTDTVEIRNPVGVQNSILRPSLLPGMVRVLVANERRGQDAVRFFEIGKTYFRRDGDFGEGYRLALGMSGMSQARVWYEEDRQLDFFDLKGTLESIAALLDVRLDFEPSSGSVLHPGRSADVGIVADGDVCRIGYVGEITPGVTEKAGSRRRLYVAEIDFDLLIEAASRGGRYAEPDRYPAVKRDLAVVVAKQIVESRVRDVIMRYGGSLVETVEIFDVYEGEHIPQGSKSLAYAIVFRDPSRTLVETDVDDLQRRIEDGLRDELGGRIRTK
jgi:phenylalanyl-tRNA synthetase beta chain